jgi:hypothetical protein
VRHCGKVAETIQQPGELTEKWTKYVPRTPSAGTGRIDEQRNIRLALCKYSAHEL